VKQYQWRRSITVAVIASLLLGLAATGLGIETLHKIDNINNINKGTEPAVTVVTPISGATISGIVGLSAKSIGPNVTAVDFVATGGPYQDVKIATGALSLVGWISDWQTKTVPNGTYRISSIGYNVSGQSSGSASITVKVKNL
jgi:hypothetical protein